MKTKLLYPLILIMIISCGRQKVVQKSAAELNAVPVRAENTDDSTVEEEIVEIEEKLVEVEEEPPVVEHYFVIIGSFRNKDNAMRYQEDIAGKGFTSVLLRNEAGFYRVSVMGVDDIEDARDEIRRIRKKHDEHRDTWLLIRME